MSYEWAKMDKEETINYAKSWLKSIETSIRICGNENTAPMDLYLERECLKNFIEMALEVKDER